MISMMQTHYYCSKFLSVWLKKPKKQPSYQLLSTQKQCLYSLHVQPWSLQCQWGRSGSTPGTLRATWQTAGRWQRWGWWCSARSTLWGEDQRHTFTVQAKHFKKKINDFVNVCFCNKNRIILDLCVCVYSIIELANIFQIFIWQYSMIKLKVLDLKYADTHYAFMLIFQQTFTVMVCSHTNWTE